MTLEYEMRKYEGMSFPYSAKTSILSQRVAIPDSDKVLMNSISTHPMEACDCNPDGSPSRYSFHRAKLLADSGAGLIWTEAMAVQEDGKSNLASQWITKENVDSYKRLIECMKEISPDSVIVAQLTHSGRFSKPNNVPAPVIGLNNPHYSRVPLPADYPLATDEYLDHVIENFIGSALLCQKAGFDGVDVKACHGYLFTDLLSAFNRPGKYGGSYENRTRILLESIEGIRQMCDSGFLLGCRFAYADTVPYPYGFGMKDDGTLEYDLTEPIRLVEDMYKQGVRLLDVSVGKVTVEPEFTNGIITEKIRETDVQYFKRFYDGAKIFHAECPEMIVIGSDYSAFGREGAYVATGAFAEGSTTMVGFGRNSLSYRGFAKDLINGVYDPSKACISCGKCTTLLRNQKPCGCPVHDKETYLPLLMLCS